MKYINRAPAPGFACQVQLNKKQKNIDKCIKNNDLLWFIELNRHFCAKNKQWFLTCVFFYKSIKKT